MNKKDYDTINAVLEEVRAQVDQYPDKGVMLGGYRVLVSITRWLDEYAQDAQRPNGVNMNTSAFDQVAEHLLGEGWVSAEDAARCARLVQEAKDLLLGTMTEEEAGEAQELLAQALLFLPDADLC